MFINPLQFYQFRSYDGFLILFFCMNLIFLDNENKQNKIREQLYKLVDKAESIGLAVGIGHARINTLEVLKQEIPKLKEYGFKFQFASFAVK